VSKGEIKATVGRKTWEKNLMLMQILKKLNRIEKKLDRYADKNEAEHAQFRERRPRLGFLNYSVT